MNLKKRKGTSIWWQEMNRMMGKKQDLFVKYTPGNLNAYFASICHTDDYITPVPIIHHINNPPVITAEQRYNQLKKQKKLPRGQISFHGGCGNRMLIP